MSLLCVTLARSRHKHMIAEHRFVAEKGGKLVELRLDYIARDVSLSRLLNDRPCGVIITCRREADGGRWNGDEDKRRTLLRAAIAAGVEYVDLEEDAAAAIPRYGKTKRVVSYHNFRETPADLDEIHARLSQRDPDIVKLATMAHRAADNVRMLQLVKRSKIPTVGVCMGEIGAPTRVLGARCGAPLTYCALDTERSAAPGQFSFREMSELYRYERINAATDVYGVIADPVAHSLSPLVHNAAFAKLGLNKVYLPFRVPREDLDDFMQDCDELGVRGLSVTIPHKEAVLRHVARLDDGVRQIGAANTLVWSAGGAEVGAAPGFAAFNTDQQAALASLIEAADDGFVDAPLKGKTVLVLGAGGAAKALVSGLRQAEAQVLIASRTKARSEELAVRFGAKALDWDKRHQPGLDILINATPVGMHPNVDETPFDGRHLHQDMIVFDTVYNPERTLLVAQARKLGCQVITGVDMFIRQAALQCELFTALKAPAQVMRDEFKRATSAAKGE